MNQISAEQRSFIDTLQVNDEVDALKENNGALDWSKAFVEAVSSSYITVRWKAEESAKRRIRKYSYDIKPSNSKITDLQFRDRLSLGDQVYYFDSRRWRVLRVKRKMTETLFEVTSETVGVLNSTHSSVQKPEAVTGRTAEFNDHVYPTIAVLRKDCRSLEFIEFIQLFYSLIGFERLFQLLEAKLALADLYQVVELLAKIYPIMNRRYIENLVDDFRLNTQKQLLASHCFHVLHMTEIYRGLQCLTNCSCSLSDDVKLLMLRGFNLDKPAGLQFMLNVVNANSASPRYQEELIRYVGINIY